MKLDFKANRQSGLYLHVGAGDRILYVGATKNNLLRQGQHSSHCHTTGHIAYWHDEIEYVAFAPMPADVAFALERRLIKVLDPPYNMHFHPTRRQGDRRRPLELSPRLCASPLCIPPRMFQPKRCDHVYCCTCCAQDHWRLKAGTLCFGSLSKKQGRSPKHRYSRAKGASGKRVA
jgi:hypothetical protein